MSILMFFNDNNLYLARINYFDEFEELFIFCRHFKRKSQNTHGPSVYQFCSPSACYKCIFWRTKILIISPSNVSIFILLFPFLIQPLECHTRQHHLHIPY